MKKILILLCLGLSLSLTAQKSEGGKIDPKFQGTWTGTESDQQQLGMVKSWIMHRAADGTFILLVSIFQDGEVQNLAEKGKWWIEDGKFHELHFVSGDTDIYEFSFLDEAHIKFKSVKIIESTNGSYEFIDTKVQEQ